MSIASVLYPDVSSPLKTGASIKARIVLGNRGMPIPKRTQESDLYNRCLTWYDEGGAMSGELVCRARLTNQRLLKNENGSLQT